MYASENFDLFIGHSVSRPSDHNRNFPAQNGPGFRVRVSRIVPVDQEGATLAWERKDEKWYKERVVWMAKLIFSEAVGKSVTEVWGVIGDFGALSKWATRVKAERIETCSDGIYRIITLDSGKIFREKLVAKGTYFYTYTVERTGTEQYEATVSVECVDDENALIIFTVDFEPKAGVDESALAADISIFFRGSLKAMKRALEFHTGASPNSSPTGGF